MRKGNKHRTNILGILTVEAAPVNCTDPEKLPALPGVAGVVLDALIVLQLPKGAPACNKSIKFSSLSVPITKGGIRCWLVIIKSTNIWSYWILTTIKGKLVCTRD